MKFKGLSILLDRNVYPPKPASLLLAEFAIKTIKPNEKILDACTGSGIVAIAIAKFVPNTVVIASDINSRAIRVTQMNATRNRVQILTVQTDLYGEFDDDEFDVITVHPPAVPYPPKKNWGMTKGMTIATNGGSDGSKLVIRSIIEAKRCLKKNGRLLLLLPHWSNTQRAFRVLKQTYNEVKELAREKIEFFPALEGNPKTDVLDYAYKLAKQGTISIKSKGEKPFSYASVIQAVKT